VRELVLGGRLAHLRSGSIRIRSPAGRSHKPGRFLLLVLRTGIQWNALNASGGWHMTFALLPGADPVEGGDAGTKREGYEGVPEIVDAPAG
jgi:hypothetical protein